jgi:hypothetical protein
MRRILCIMATSLLKVNLPCKPVVAQFEISLALLRR